jgi:D-arabinose 1-dehydrogenase-like Zn-dependent alcohol dehydrogenase
MNIPPGSIVSIQGLGGLGNLALQYANKFGYRVVAISRDSVKEEFSRALGAHEYIDASNADPGEALQKLEGASLIIATSPTAESMTPPLKGLGMLGNLLL